MKIITLRSLFFTLIILFNLLAKSQSSYTDSLQSYQLNYKKDLYSIIQKDTEYVKFYGVDSNYKVVAKLTRLSGQSFFSMPTSGKAKDAVRFATASFTLNGKEFTLQAYQLKVLLASDKYKDDFFIPFTDSTSGIETYGGGRYLDFTLKDIRPDSTLVIDFNKAYNPYCAFRTGYNCPIPPKENDLPASVRAGEMNFGKH